MKHRNLWAALLVLSLVSLTAFAEAEAKAEAKAEVGINTGDPQELIRDTANRVLEEVVAHKTELDEDSSGIYLLVEKTVVPHFDFPRMSRTALGRFWRTATDDQKHRLTGEFQKLLVRTYAIALLNYSGQKIEYLPVRMRSGATDVQVPTRVSSNGGPSIPINYRLHSQAGDWMVYDVVIDGISLVSNYRSTFAAEVRRGGIDGLINTLAKRNKKLSG